LAPTTIVGQLTLTTPDGRSAGREGFPIAMCEIIDKLNAPVYIERVSLGDAARIMRAKRAVKQALTNQMNRKGFSFVEILSPCPVNWKMSPIEARKWLIANLEPLFPVRNFRNLEEAPAKYEHRKPMADEALLKTFSSEKSLNLEARKGRVEDQYVKIAGFGGQGVMSAGVLLANCAVAEQHNATWLPSYGPEMRGGTANAGIIISNKQIGSPMVDHANFLIAMNAPSLDSFEDSVVPRGTIIVNSSLIGRKARRSDVKVLYAPVTEIAARAGLTATATVAALTMYALASGAVTIETIKKVIPLSIKKKSLIDVNLHAVDLAAEYYANNFGGGV
jgi:2-oxoisovalerate ferredoxin oxidoreductase beta subunit